MALKKSEIADMFLFLTQDLSEKVKKQILAVTGRGNTSAARDYIQANCLITEVLKENPELDLSTITDSSQLWDALHPATRFRLKSYTPCLAARYDELKPEQQKKVFDDPNWTFTEKENGARGWLIIHNGVVKLFSRNYSDKDCGLLEYNQNIHQYLNPEFKGTYAIDVEIKFEPGADIRNELEELGLETDSPLEAMVAMLHTYPHNAIAIQEKFKEKYGKDLIAFKLIAPLYFNGKNYLGRTLGEGQDVYDECVEFGRSLGFNVIKIKRCNGTRAEKEVFLDTILNAGGEGIVAHYRLGSYCTSENRSKTSFIKLKRSISATMNKEGLGDSIDAFVTGFKVGTNGTANEGLIAALNMSIYINDNGRTYEHMIASVPNLDLETKKLCTLHDNTGLWPQEITLSDGTTTWISLNPEFGGLVGTVDGQALSAKSKRLEHPRLLTWRFERFPESCIYTKEFIDSQTTTIGVKY